ncbi:hypothetical protein DPMN_030858 [Dreissena polymorpha]|uniref:Secreted protein n=1 Tax=Dreissena polymorpha TaxID=45954 RepID=A0A9D4M1J0_DREPO|nr:hypothetical protein DPMN_030858 [Dreissena polymorpha]
MIELLFMWWTSSTGSTSCMVQSVNTVQTKHAQQCLVGHGMSTCGVMATTTRSPRHCQHLSTSPC